MPPRAVCGILLRRLERGLEWGTGPKRGRASRWWRRSGVGWHLPSIKASPRFVPANLAFFDDPL